MAGSLGLCQVVQRAAIGLYFWFYIAVQFSQTATLLRKGTAATSGKRRDSLMNT